MSFLERLRAAQQASASRLCVGLDPDPAHLPAPLRDLAPAKAISAFCRTVIEATAPYACAFKPNVAFFEALGPEGWRAFEEVVAAVPPDRLVVADAKRGDIGSTARRYAEAFFGRTRADAVTVSPYMGRDALTPFLAYPGRAAFVLVLTSNEGARDLQLLPTEGVPLYHRVAALALHAAEGQPGSVGFVVGATRPEPLAELRDMHPYTPFLVPGVGAQGGEPASVVRAAAHGPLVVNVGRAILYASGGTDYARAAADTAASYREALGRPA